MKGAVVKTEGHGVEHVLPVVLFPPAILVEVNPELRVSDRDFRCDLALGGPAVSEETLANRLRRIEAKLQPPRSSQPGRRANESIEIVQPRHGVSVCLLDDQSLRLVRADKGAQLSPCFGEASLLRQKAEGNNATRCEPTSVQDGIAEFAEAGIESENCVTSSFHIA